MEFIAHDTLRNVIKTASKIHLDKVDGFELSNLEGYKNYLRELLSNFHDEMAINFRECSDDNIINNYLIQLEYNLSKWLALHEYAKQKMEFVLIDRDDVVNSTNVLQVKEFLKEKVRYCKKVIDEFNRQINILKKNTEHKGESSAVKVKVVANDGKILRDTGFCWQKTPTLRGTYFSLLKEHELILKDVALDKLKLAFPLADFGDLHEPIKIKWIALTEKSRDFHKGALVYLISELARNGFIKDHEIRIRNKKITHCFVDNEGSKIEHLNNARIPTKGVNKDSIDRLIHKLIVEQNRN